MTAAQRANLRIAAVFCGVIGLYDILYVTTTIFGTAVLGYKVDVLFPDFLVFHAAARAFFEGKLGLVYDTAAITHLQNTLYASRLPFELGFRPFLYPPLWLLGLLPFGLLPVGLSVATFLMLTAGICVVALRALGLRFEAVLAILVAPAAIWVVIAGQNTFLSVALLYGGLALLERRPILAGVLLGLLAYKPQVWVLVPLALLAACAWRPLIALAVTVLVLALATLLLFGADFWLAFFDAARHAGEGAAAAEMYGRVGTQMTTLLAAGKKLGLDGGPAMVLQLTGAAFAVVAVAWAFARHRPSHERTAVLVTATFLVSPYTLNYDLLLLMPAVALLYLHPPPEGYRLAERTIYLAVWLIPNFCMAFNAAGVPLTPLVILLFGAIAWVRLKSQSKVELPGLATAG
jgi:hypothetical protein